MARRTWTVEERRLLEELQEIDRSLLLLVDARDRAVQRVHPRARGKPDPARRALGRSTRTAILEWGEEIGAGPGLADRLSRWLAAESGQASRRRGPVDTAPTVTCRLRVAPHGRITLRDHPPKRAPESRIVLAA